MACICRCRVDNRTVLITAADTPIGIELVRELSRRGARVIMACKNVQLGQDIAVEVFNAYSYFHQDSIYYVLLDYSFQLLTTLFPARLSASRSNIRKVGGGQPPGFWGGNSRACF